MEILTTITVFWFAGVLTAMYSLYYPAWRFVRDAKPKNIFVQRKLLALFVVFVLFTLTSVSYTHLTLPTIYSV